MPKTPNLTVVQPPALPAGPRARVAYERALSDIERVPNDELVPIRVDVSDLVTAALGVVPKVVAFRERARALPEFDVSCFDELETRALALLHAHTRYLAACAARDEVPELARRARALRATFRSDIQSLQGRKRLSQDALHRLQSTTGHSATFSDLTALVEILRRHWPELAGLTGATEAELNEAELVAEKLVDALGARPRLSQEVRRAAHVRAQAFTLLLQTYSEVQRAVSFFRWRERDADRFAPSLFRGFVGRPRKARRSGRAARERAANAQIAGAGPPSALPQHS